MQRWFFADEQEKCKPICEPLPEELPEEKKPEPQNLPDRLTNFCVLVRNYRLKGNEFVALAGNCLALGNWNFRSCVIMQKHPLEPQKWTAELMLPMEGQVKYRYLIVAIDPSNETLIVRRWEAFHEARVVPLIIDRECKDVFGDSAENKNKVLLGWATSECLVQFKVFNSPIHMRKKIKRRANLQCKITPQFKRKNEEKCVKPTKWHTRHFSIGDCEDTYSVDSRETNPNLSTSFAFCEVSSLTNKECSLRPQPCFGVPCNKPDMAIYHLTIGDIANTVYLVELFTFDDKASVCEAPYSYAYGYVMPERLKGSRGCVQVQLLCSTKHRPIGSLKLDYLIIKPMKDGWSESVCITFQKRWNPLWQGLNIGHRGLGVSFSEKGKLMRENTIHSLRMAVDKGADFVEFDVQLSKDLVPLLYHDYKIVLEQLNPKHNMREVVNLADFTLEELRALPRYKFECDEPESTCIGDKWADNQPFPTLESVFKAINISCGFLVEVKWPMLLKSGRYEEGYKPNKIDSNVYIDAILKVVLENASGRRIIFASFEPEICALLRFKQNLYPVMFLTRGGVENRNLYKDNRLNLIDLAICEAIAMELLGIIFETEQLLTAMDLINTAHSKGLIVFAYGNKKIKYLKYHGLQAIIYDKLHRRSGKTVFVNAFHQYAMRKDAFQRCLLHAERYKPV